MVNADVKVDFIPNTNTIRVAGIPNLLKYLGTVEILSNFPERYLMVEDQPLKSTITKSLKRNETKTKILISDTVRNEVGSFRKEYKSIR